MVCRRLPTPTEATELTAPGGWRIHLASVSART